MDEIISEVRRATAAKLYFLALMGALALIDISEALASDNGGSSGSKFKDWVRSNVPEQDADADLISDSPCSLLHQARAHPRGSVFPIPDGRLELCNI